MTRPRVLFVCHSNAGPSRMAAAYLDRVAGERYEALSAGPEPADAPRREVVEVMAEDGIVLAAGAGVLVTGELVASADRVVDLGGALPDDALPEPGVPFEEWGIPDPAGRPLPEVRVLRDTVKRLVDRLVARMDTEAVVR